MARLIPHKDFTKLELISAIENLKHQVSQYETLLGVTPFDKELLKGDKGDIGIQGEKGNPFLYKDFTQAQLEEFKKPAQEAAVLVIEAIQRANIAIDRANSATSEANSATQLVSQSQLQVNRLIIDTERLIIDADNKIADLEEIFRLGNNILPELTLAKNNALSATTNADLAARRANTSSTNADEKANLAETATERTLLATTKTIEATGNANRATDRANISADEANAAKDSLLSNIISIEIRDDLCLWLETPDVYEGVMFEIENGNLKAIV